MNPVHPWARYCTNRPTVFASTAAKVAETPNPSGGDVLAIGHERICRTARLRDHNVPKPKATFKGDDVEDEAYDKDRDDADDGAGVCVRMR